MLCAVPQLMKVPWGGRKKYPPPSGVPGTEAPRTRTERARGRQAVPERQLGGRVLPNGKLLREKIVFLKLMTGSKRKTPMVSETLDSCFSISKYCFQFPERVEKFAHNELGMSQWGQSACGGDALVPSAICLQWLRFQPAFPISSVGGGGGGAQGSWPPHRGLTGEQCCLLMAGLHEGSPCFCCGSSLTMPGNRRKLHD